MDTKNIRLFFAVDSDESNKEIFDNYDEANMFAKSLIENCEENVNMSIEIVRNAYKEGGVGETGYKWNYDDRSDTFNWVKNVDITIN